jgi:hypothetical protein
MASGSKQHAEAGSADGWPGRAAPPTGDCNAAQAAEAAAGGASCAADGAAPAVREHNLYVKHFEAGVDSAALRSLFEARIVL